MKMSDSVEGRPIRLKMFGPVIGYTDIPCNWLRIGQVKAIANAAAPIRTNKAFTKTAVRGAFSGILNCRCSSWKVGAHGSSSGVRRS